MTPYLRTIPEPELAPPLLEAGALGWLRTHLFSSALNAATTVLVAALAAWTLPPLIGWATWNAVWSAPDGALCRAHQEGACWAFIGAKLQYLLYGSYPEAQRWRVDVTEALGGVLILWLLWPQAPRKAIALALFFVAYPVVAFVLLSGAPALGLPKVDTLLWGGVFVTLLTALVGIVVSLPLGVLLALGRRAQMPLVRATSVVFIEVVRGVPFITVLFMANNMLPLFLPPGVEPDRFLRPLVGIVLFAAAYLAEEVRGGLQTLPRGQFEGALALGFNYRLMMALVVLPQAMVLVIPGLVNNMIGLFKDTTLVEIVGINDFLAALGHAMKDPAWAGPTIFSTGYAFAGLFYFVICYAMSLYSGAMERRHNSGLRR